PHRGPVFLDFPMDVVFLPTSCDVPEPVIPRGDEPDPDDVRRAAALVARAERPALVAGSDVYWDGAWDALRRCVEAWRIPTFVSGLGRGCLAADHELAFSRTRSFLNKGADVVVVVGTPLAFRLRFGDYGQAQVVHIVDSAGQRAGHVTPAVSPAGDLSTILDGMAAYDGDRTDHQPWIDSLREAETAARARDEGEMTADTDRI